MATDAQVAQARAAVYDFLAALFTYHYELDEVQERLTRRIPRVQAAVEVLRERGYHLDERGVLAAVRQITAIEDLTDLQAEHVALLDMPSPGGRSAPLESVQRHGVVHPETLAALEAFYRTFGVALAPDAEVPGDHCSVELAFMGFLAFQEAVAHGQGAGGNPTRRRKPRSSGITSSDGFPAGWPTWRNGPPTPTSARRRASRVRSSSRTPNWREGRGRPRRSPSCRSGRGLRPPQEVARGRNRQGGDPPGRPRPRGPPHAVPARDRAVHRGRRGGRRSSRLGRGVRLPSCPRSRSGGTRPGGQGGQARPRRDGPQGSAAEAGPPGGLATRGPRRPLDRRRASIPPGPPPGTVPCALRVPFVQRGLPARGHPVAGRPPGHNDGLPRMWGVRRRLSHRRASVAPLL